MIASVETVCTLLGEIYPKASCSLIYKTPFQLLVSVVLSAQSTDGIVNKIMAPIYEKGFEPQTLLYWGEVGIRDHIRRIGLWQRKSRYILELARRCSSGIPDNFSELILLPGVGVKTAQVYLGEIYQQPTLAVDTHVFRVTARLGWHSASSPLEAWKVLINLVPKKHLPKLHYRIIEHGRKFCRARKPSCNLCPLRVENLCPWGYASV